MVLNIFEQMNTSTRLLPLDRCDNNNLILFNNCSYSYKIGTSGEKEREERERERGRDEKGDTITLTIHDCC